LLAEQASEHFVFSHGRHLAARGSEHPEAKGSTLKPGSPGGDFALIPLERSLFKLRLHPGLFLVSRRASRVTNCGHTPIAAPGIPSEAILDLERHPRAIGQHQGTVNQLVLKAVHLAESKLLVIRH
jgi:hypothetical protein